MTVKYFMLEMSTGAEKADATHNAIESAGEVYGFFPEGDLFPGIRADVADVHRA